MEQAKKLKAVEEENQRLKRLVADQALNTYDGQEALSATSGRVAVETWICRGYLAFASDRPSLRSDGRREGAMCYLR
jgi:hypothetical protein